MSGEIDTELDDGAWEADGALRLSKFNSLFKREAQERRYTTVAGLILHRLDQRPAVGDAVTVDGITLRIIAMDGLRIARVRIEPPEHVAPPSSGGATTDEQHGSGEQGTDA